MRWVFDGSILLGFSFYSNLTVYVFWLIVQAINIQSYYWDMICYTRSLWLIFGFELGLDSPLSGYSFRIVPPFADLHHCFSFLPHGIFCWECSVVPAFFSLILLALFIMEGFISSSNLKISFAGYKILDWHSFSFRVWNMLF